MCNCNCILGTVIKSLSYDESYIPTSISFSPSGDLLAVGGENGILFILNIAVSTVCKFVLCSHRLASCVWKDNNILVASCRCGSLYIIDQRESSLSNTMYHAHRLEICGLQWNCDKTLLASGSNDNLVKIWDFRTSLPYTTIDKHEGAVKALAWDLSDPLVLASGGGSADMKIRVTHIGMKKELSVLHSHSAVTGIVWLDKEHLFSSHGYVELFIFLQLL